MSEFYCCFLTKSETPSLISLSLTLTLSLPTPSGNNPSQRSRGSVRRKRSRGSVRRKRSRGSVRRKRSRGSVRRKSLEWKTDEYKLDLDCGTMQTTFIPKRFSNPLNVFENVALKKILRFWKRKNLKIRRICIRATYAKRRSHFNAYKLCSGCKLISYRGPEHQKRQRTTRATLEKWCSFVNEKCMTCETPLCIATSRN